MKYRIIQTLEWMGSLNFTSLREDGWTSDRLLDGTKQGDRGNVLVEWTHEGKSKSRLLKPGEYQEVSE